MQCFFCEVWPEPGLKYTFVSILNYKQPLIQYLDKTHTDKNYFLKHYRTHRVLHIVMDPWALLDTLTKLDDTANQAFV